MELYLLKSSACLLILLSFYKLFLEKENLHTFKRFYLLGALIVSITIPGITFISYTVLPETISNSLVIVTAAEGPETINYLGITLWVLYGIGVVIFGLKFIININNIRAKIEHNPKLKQSGITNVLMRKEVTPHTFFSFIFLNKERFETNEIPAEVLLHEKTHAIQKHSIDVLIIELIQVVFWFNPLVYLLKNAIKLNHEFLADQAVIKNSTTSAHYQNLLLEFSSNSAPQLANSINYSSIKKRITVMKTETSKKRSFLRTALLLPLLALLLFGFSSREIAITETKNSSITAKQENQKKATPAQVKEYNALAKKYNTSKKEGMMVVKKDIARLSYLFGLMSSKQRKSAESFPSFPPQPKAPKPLKVLKGVNDQDPNIPPPPPKNSKPVKVIKGVNDTDPNIPPPPPKAPKPIKVLKGINDKDPNVPPPPPKTPKPVKVLKGVNDTDSNIPPPPIMNTTTLDDIRRIADENAAFFHEGKRISKDKAFSLVKENTNLNIAIETFKKSNPIVKITKN